MMKYGVVQEEAKGDQGSHQTKKVDSARALSAWARPVDLYSTTCWLVSVTKNIWEDMFCESKQIHYGGECKLCRVVK